LPRLPGVEWSEQYKLWRYGFQRGFVVQATFANGRAYRDHAEAAFAATPLEEVRFTRLTARTGKAVAAPPLPARLGHPGVGILRAGTVGELNRPTNELGEGGVLLASSPHLGRLRTLDLDGNGVGDAGAGALAANAALRGLHWLKLTANRVGPAGAAALAA